MRRAWSRKTRSGPPASIRAACVERCAELLPAAGIRGVLVNSGELFTDQGVGTLITRQLR